MKNTFFYKKFYYFLVLFSLIFQISLSARSLEKYEVAICAIFQNEAPYLKEWIEFHRIIGVEHFYLYNNRSTDEFRSVLKEYIDKGIVEIIEWSYTPNRVHGWGSIQCGAYQNAVKISKNKVKWLAIIDIDEFLVPVESNSLPEFLKKYENYAGISVNWQMFGTSFIHKIQPNEVMIEKLLLRASVYYPENRHVKTIVRPMFVKKFTNPHNAVFKPGFYSVNSDKEIILGPLSDRIVVDKICINHYWTRDEDYFIRNKIPRRVGWLDGGSFERLNQLNKETDTLILKYLPELKKRLFNE